MATLYLKSAGGNWSAAGTWSNVNAAGADNSGPPTAADNCIAELASGNLTIDGTSGSPSLCRSFDTTSGTGSWGGQLTAGATAQINIGDGTAGAGNVALKLNSGITFAPNAASLFNFISTSSTKQTIDFGGKTIGNITFNASSNGNWALTTGVTTSTSSTVTLTKGTLQTDGTSDNSGLSHSWGLFDSNGSLVRTLTLGTSTFTIKGASSTVWNLGTTTNLTFTGASSTIILNGANVTWNGGGKTYGSLNLTGSGTAQIQSANDTFTNFTRTGTSSKTDTLQLNNNISGNISGSLTLSGNSSVNRLLVTSNNFGVSRTMTITGATITCSNVDFKDITLSVSQDFSARNDIGDCGGNSGIIFPSSVTQTWSGTSGGNWSANAWTTRVPLPQDDVVVSSAFSASQTIIQDMPRIGRNIDFTGTTGAPTWSFQSTQDIYGSITLASGMLMASSQNFNLQGRNGSYTITSAGVNFGGITINYSSSTATYCLNDAFQSTGFFVPTGGTFTTNNFNLTCQKFAPATSTTRTMNLGTSIITLNRGSGLIMDNSNVNNLTWNGQNATFVYAGGTSGTVNFNGGGLTYGTLTYTAAGSTNELDITGSNTFNTINFYDASNARSLKFTAGTTTTITGSFNVQGTAGKLMTVDSITASGHTLTKSSGTVSCNYLDVGHSTATGGAAWYAGANSTDEGTNSGWIFQNSVYSTGNFVKYSSQQILNLINGSVSLNYTEQEVANIYNKTPIHSLSFQEVLNTRAGRSGTSMSTQQALYNNLKTFLSLSGSDTQYSVQELLNMAYDKGASMLTIFG